MNSNQWELLLRSHYLLINNIMEITIVIIENDAAKYKDDPLIWTLRDKYTNVKFYEKSSEGLEYIKENLNNNMIVLLDIDFPASEKSGHVILKEITDLSRLIPVILWSGIDENTEPFVDLINNHAFAFMSKTITIGEAMKIIDEAKLFLTNSLDNTIEDWIINKTEDKDKQIYITTSGTAYSLNDILKEIRLQTKVGKDFSKKLNSLTIDLLLRNKENLNG